MATNEEIDAIMAIAEARLGERERNVAEAEQVLDKGAPRTLRDYFAAQALAGLMANSGGPLQSNDYSGWGYANCDIGDIAAEAYRIADAMLAARSK